MSPLDHRLRQGVYRVLGGAYRPASSEFLSVAGGSLDVLTDLGLFDYAYALDLADALTALERSSPEELAVAYVTLFETGEVGGACAARESAQLGNPRNGDVALIEAQLRRAYARLGIDVDLTRPDEVDHVATELDAMATLCGRAADDMTHERGATSSLHGQVTFAREHVLRWVPDLGRMICRVSTHPTYEAVGRATVAFLEHDRQHLATIDTVDLVASR